jgi:hypothetical protein
MVENGIDWFCGCHHVGDYTKTLIDYDCLDVSRDDVMDENGIIWFSRCHHVEFHILEDEEIS